MIQLERTRGYPGGQRQQRSPHGGNDRGISIEADIRISEGRIDDEQWGSGSRSGETPVPIRYRVDLGRVGNLSHRDGTKIAQRTNELKVPEVAGKELRRNGRGMDGWMVGKVLRTTVGPVPHVAVSAGGLPPGLRPSNFVQPLREAYCSSPDSKQTFLCTYLWAVLLAGLVLDSTLG